MGKFGKRISLVFLVLLLFIVAGCSSSTSNEAGSNESNNSSEQNENNEKKEKEEAITLKIAHVLAQDTTSHKRFEKFKELIEEQSNGKFKVEIYPDGQLGGEREMAESVQMGNIQITSPSVGVLSNFSSALKVFDFPFLFKDKQIAYDVLDGPIGTDLLKDLEGSGFIGLGYGDLGYRHITSNKKVVTPADIQDMKLRTMEVPMHMAFWEHLGAIPTPMAFTEVYTALSQGVVDGQENPYQLVYNMKFHEPNKFITATGHIYDSEPVIINKDFYESLEVSDQQLIRDLMLEAINYQRELNKDLNEDLISKLESEGAEVTQLTPEQKQAWIDELKPFYTENYDEVGKELLLKVLEAADNQELADVIK